MVRRAMTTTKKINVGIPAHWGTLPPPLQHSALGSAVLQNQFEPLVRPGGRGLVVPMAASSWEASKDFRLFRFNIDTTRRFSDGSNLSAKDFKRSWEEGVALSKDSGKVDFQEILQVIYKTHDTDLLLASFSVANGDPDGLYHVLGKEGAIFTPMMERDGIAERMAEGRKILDRTKLPLHYEKVARLVLADVPFIHLGYSFRGIAYNSAKLQITDNFINRDDYRLTTLKPK